MAESGEFALNRLQFLIRPFHDAHLPTHLWGLGFSLSLGLGLGLGLG